MTSYVPIIIRETSTSKTTITATTTTTTTITTTTTTTTTTITITTTTTKGLACLTTDHEVAGSITGTSTNFKCGLGLERGPPSFVRTIA